MEFPWVADCESGWITALVAWPNRTWTSWLAVVPLVVAETVTRSWPEPFGTARMDTAGRGAQGGGAGWVGEGVGDGVGDGVGEGVGVVGAAEPLTAAVALIRP